MTSRRNSGLFDVVVDTALGLFIVLMSLLTIISLGQWLFTESKVEEPTHEQQPLVIVYDSEPEDLKYVEGKCSECGAECNGINGEIVCRNEECSLYGITQNAE